jgi:hypothetical protein
MPELAQAHAHMTLQVLGQPCNFDTVVKVLESIDVQAIVEDVWSADRVPGR